MRTESAAVPARLVLPSSAADLVEQLDVSKRHPGLQLDKLSPPGDQKAQRQAIEDVCGAARGEALLNALSSRRAKLLESLAARRFQAETTGPLTLHLARASGMENAGIHLHSVYGFVCLPGSGLKGMARAWAETVWLEDQDDRAAAWDRIRAVFGRTPATDAGKPWRPGDAAPADGSRAGAVVFHDAWPTAWPRLEADIVNNHHAKYYEGADEPGDWEDPIPVYFLAVSAGVTFDFAVSPRSAANDAESRLTDLAIEWLRGALAHEGAGAKTNAGYGRFRLNDAPSVPAPGSARAVAKHTLTLATPAFLAGAGQQRDDCDLRPATLRGLLRWWWRTMHAAHLETAELRRLETVVWGDARSGGALAVAIEGDVRAHVRPFDKREIARKHQLERPRAKTAQGLAYLAYGMDERDRRRYYAEPGASWTVTLTARRGRLPEGERPVAGAEILRQGEAALWLLCHYGGVGSKARKGFGSFAEVEVADIAAIDDCKRRAAAFRRAVGVAERLPGPVGSSSLEEMLVLEVETPWKNRWFAIDQLGFAAQAFARENAHREEKAALGLPRKIHKPPKSLSASRHRRHAAPVHYHLSPRADDTLTIRMTVFPSPVLPDLDTSRKVLGELRARLRTELTERVRTHAGRGTRTPKQVAAPSGPGAGDAGPSSVLPQTGERVDAVLLDEKTKKGGWKAKHEASGLQGPIQNAADVPGEVEPGRRVDLVVASVNRNRHEIAFRWPAADEGGSAGPGGAPSRQGRGARRPGRGRRG